MQLDLLTGDWELLSGSELVDPDSGSVPSCRLYGARMLGAKVGELEKIDPDLCDLQSVHRNAFSALNSAVALLAGASDSERLLLSVGEVLNSPVDSPAVVPGIGAAEAQKLPPFLMPSVLPRPLREVLNGC